MSTIARELREAVLSPAFWWQCRRDARRSRMHWIRAGCALVFFGILVSLASSASSQKSVVGEGSVNPYQQLGQHLFQVFMIGQLVVGYVLAAALASGIISGERRQGTLELLLSTHLTPFQIIAGKYVSRMAGLALDLLSATPVLAIGMLLGGISAERLIWAELLCLSTVMFVGAMATFFSTVQRNTGLAMVGGLLGPVVWWSGWGLGALIFVLGPIAIIAAIAMVAVSFLGRVNVLLVLEPAAFLFSIVSSSERLGLGGSMAAALSVLINLGLCLVVLVIAAQRLLRTMGQTPSMIAPGTTLRVLSSAGQHAALRPVRNPMVSQDRIGVKLLTMKEGHEPSVGTDEAARVPRRSRVIARALRGRADTEVWDNPVAWRELRGKRFGLGRVALWVGGGMLLVTTLVNVIALQGGSEGLGRVHAGLMVVDLVLMALTGAVWASVSFASEREQGTLEPLLVTPLTGRQIVLGKLLGAGRLAGVFAGLALLQWLVALATAQWWARWPLLLIVGAFVVSVTALALSFGMAISIAVRKTYTAVSITLGVLAGVLVGLPIVCSWLEDAFLRYAWVDLVDLANPYLFCRLLDLLFREKHGNALHQAAATVGIHVVLAASAALGLTIYVLRKLERRKHVV